MIAHIDDEADLMTVLSRLSSRYSGLLGVSAEILRGPLENPRNGNILQSAFGSSFE
jgi:hypothetical protein